MKRFGFASLMLAGIQSHMNVFISRALIGLCLCAAQSAWAAGSGTIITTNSSTTSLYTFTAPSGQYISAVEGYASGSTFYVKAYASGGTSGVIIASTDACFAYSSGKMTVPSGRYLKELRTDYVDTSNICPGSSCYTLDMYLDNGTRWGTFPADYSKIYHSCNTCPSSWTFSDFNAPAGEVITGFTAGSGTLAAVSSTLDPSFSFIHLTDTHVGDSKWAAIVRTDYDVDGVAFGQMASFICGMANKPAFVVDSGDVVDWGACFNRDLNPNFQKLLSFLSPWDATKKRYYIDKTAKTIPIYFSLGNHDTRDRLQVDTGDPYDFHWWIFGDDPKYIEHDDIADYHLVQSNALIIVMDSGRDTLRFNWENPLENPEGNGFTASQMTWLKDTIKNNSSLRPKILVMHHPAANGLGKLCNTSAYCGPVLDGGDGSFVDERADFFNVMAGTIGGISDASWKVDVVLTGHVHQSLIADATGTPFAFTGGTHTPTDPTWYVQTGAAYTGLYRIITVDGSNVTVGEPTRAAGVGSCSASPRYAIAGRIKIDGTTAGLADVTVTLNTGASTTTDSDGFFSINGLAQGTYTVTPALAGYTFSPPAPQGEICNMDVAANFAATCVSLATPETPTFPTIGTTTLTLSWPAVTGATSYDVYRTLEGSPICALALKVGTVNGGVTTYDDSGLTSGTQYLYSIVAKSACGSSLPGPCGSVKTVSESPSITTQPSNQTVTPGAAATFNVVASGTPPLSYQWYRGGASISGANAATYTIAATTTADNGANFTATISNTTGTATSNAAVLTVAAAALSIAWSSGGSITLSWSGDAASYDVYSTTDYAGGFGGNPIAVVTTTTWTDSDASAYPQRYYRVAAHGGSAFSRVVGKFDLTLQNGMNLVSMPLIPDDNSIVSVMHQDASYYPVLEVWVRKPDGLYMKATFNPQDPANYWDSGSDPFTTLSVDKGYWFKTAAAAVFTLLGAVPTASRTITLGEGMHIVGWASVNSKRFLDAIPQTPTDYHVTELFERQVSGQYSLAYYLYDYPPDYWWSADSNFQGMTPGKGYWFKVSGSYTWTYDP
ncbi:MAG: metallophosphoesterase [Acidobacteria bacterium]|nr:metallophosphoesterase [Acidobacteriota bacterium]